MVEVVWCHRKFHFIESIRMITKRWYVFNMRNAAVEKNLDSILVSQLSGDQRFQIRCRRKLAKAYQDWDSMSVIVATPLGEMEARNLE